MIINHNIAALNTYRQLSNNNVVGNKSLEKLSSGLRINRAGDDAAGLAISEKMRAQIRGLDQAVRNAQDGISLIQTAEGNLNETHSILQRMRELAVQSSNDTNTGIDRNEIQSEIQQLKEEIDRIGNTTEFNTIKLIDGSIGAKRAPGVDNAAVIALGLGEKTAASTTAAGDFNTVDDGKISDLAGDLTDQTINVDGASIKFDVTKAELNAVGHDTTGAKFAELLQTKINDAIEKYNNAYDQDVAKISVMADGDKITITSGTTGGASGITFDAAKIESAGDGNIWNIAGYASEVGANVAGTEGVFTAAGLGAANSIDAADKSTVTVDGVELEVTWAQVGGKTSASGSTYAEGEMDKLAIDIATDINAAISKYNSGVPAEKRLENVTTSVKDGGIVIQSGSKEAKSSIKFDKSTAAQAFSLAGSSSATQGGGISFQIGANQSQTMKITVEDMRSDALGIASIDLSTREGAEEATTIINDAIEKVSSQRSSLGAFQNRLEHTINNLGTSSENLTAAESRIRDVDMAKEMMEFTKMSILSQAAQAMLAQANQQPQGVLQLLR